MSPSLSQCYYQVRTRWLPQDMRQTFGVRRIMCVINSIFLVIEPYQHSWCFTKPNKSSLMSCSGLFTHPIIPRLLQDQEIMSIRPCTKLAFTTSTILEKLSWKSFITLLTHNSGGIFYPSSGISLLVQASISILLIPIFLPSFNSCPPAILSWNL